MKPGNLVRINRAMIGVPTGSLGLLIKKEKNRDSHPGLSVWTVKFVCRDHTRRLLGRDLEVINESR